jgi:phage terminase large subunit
MYIDHEAYAVGCEIDNTPDLFDTVPGSRKWKITADSARPETISYMQRNGFKIVGAKKGNGSVEDGINFLLNFDIIVHPRCKHVIDEFTHYSWKVDKRTDEVLPVLADDHNHMIDAVRYALESSRRSGFFMVA